MAVRRADDERVRADTGATVSAATIAPISAGPSDPERPCVQSASRREEFESMVLRNLDAAYNLARWLLRNDHDAADVVQDACAKAWGRIGQYRGGDDKAWLLAIVRNVAIDHRRRNSRSTPAALDDGTIVVAPHGAPPLESLVRAGEDEWVRRALGHLPDAHREILVLREIEGLTYAQIAVVTGIPAGTVMSRLSRARDALAAALRASARKE